jgi:hypothetical protein
MVLITPGIFHKAYSSFTLVIKNQAKKRKNKNLIRADALKNAIIIPKKKRKKRSKTVISKLLSSTGPLYLVWANHKWTCCHKVDLPLSQLDRLATYPPSKYGV